MTYVLDIIASLKPGDTLVTAGNRFLDRVIQLCTLSKSRLGHPATHVLFAAHLCGNTNRPLLLWESSFTVKLPCYVQGRVVRGVQCHPVLERIRYEWARGGRLWLYRLRKPLKPWEQETLAIACRRSLGTPYDRFGAFRARTLGCGWLAQRLERHFPTAFARLVPDVENNGKYFCNEFVAAMLRTVRRFRRPSASRFNPATFVLAQIVDGIVEPKGIEIERPMVG